MIGTPRKMRLTSWDGNPPACGEYMISNGGSAYLVIAFNPTKGAAPKSVGGVDMVKLAPHDEIPPGSVVHRFQWNPRNRGTRR